MTVIVLLIGLVGAGGLARYGPDARKMKVDVFPPLNLPVIYVCQPYGGMDPQQMEGLIANYYEYHFLYISGIHHVESRNVKGLSLMKLYFHPETNMARAMAETVGYVNRSRAFMPPGTVQSFIMRFDTGSVPVGYLVLSSESKTIAQIQDQALFRVRPMFAALPGVSAPVRGVGPHNGHPGRPGPPAGLQPVRRRRRPGPERRQRHQPVRGHPPAIAHAPRAGELAGGDAEGF